MTRATSATRFGALVAALAVLASGCGSPASTAAPAPVPYAGPLSVPPAPGRDLWEDPGAAGQITDCDHGVIGGSSTNPFSGGEVGSTPRDALREAHDEGGWDGPIDRMQVVREEPDRVLFGYAVQGRVKQAVVVHHGPAAEGTGAGEDGVAWWVESWARCDLAEYPAEVAASLDYQVWTDAAGRRLPIRTVVSYPGGDCVPGTTFLELGRGSEEPDGRQVYVAHGEDFPTHFAEAYRADVPLPADAVDTGYTHDGDHLWLSPGRERAYVSSGDRVDLWPRTVQELGCA